MRKKAGPLGIVDLVEEVRALCRLQQIACPSRPAIDRRLERASGVTLSAANRVVVPWRL